MSDPRHTAGAEVDPSEDAIDEGAEQQGLEAADAEGRDSSTRRVDPSEQPTE